MMTDLKYKGIIRLFFLKEMFYLAARYPSFIDMRFYESIDMLDLFMLMVL